jgi:hypothetical protein
MARRVLGVVGVQNRRCSYERGSLSEQEEKGEKNIRLYQQAQREDQRTCRISHGECLIAMLASVAWPGVHASCYQLMGLSQDRGTYNLTIHPPAAAH